MLAERLMTSLGGALLFLAAGLGIVSAFPGLRRRPLAARLGFAWLFGVLAVGGGAWIAAHFLGVLLRRTLFLSLVLGSVALGIWSRRKEGAPVLRTTFPSRIVFFGLFVCGFVTLGLLSTGLTNPLNDWDGRQHWLAAARIVRAEATVDARVLRERQWYVSHPRYPILEPLAVVAEQEIFDAGEDDRAARPFYLAFYPVWLLLVFHFARRRAGPTAAALAALAAALPFMTTFELWGGPTSAYNDMPLACFLGAGFLLLLERDRRTSAGLAAGLFLAGAVLTKNEGAPFALAALGATALLETHVVLCARRRGRAPARTRIRALLAAALPVAAALALLASWRSGIENRFDEGYQASVPALVDGFRSSLALWGPEIPKEMVRNDKWGFFWWVVPIVFAAGSRGLRRGPSGTVVLFLGGAAAVIFAAYSVGWAGHADVLARATWNRFLIQVSLPGLLLYALALRECLRSASELGFHREPRAAASTPSSASL